MKTVLFTPGFHSEEVYEQYHGRPALELIERHGYQVRFVPIHWKHRTVDDWMRQLREEYVRHDPVQTILAGFSFGAITSLAIAAERQPAELWLFSISPFFAEDLKFQKPAYLKRVIGKRRTEAFSRLDFKQITSQIDCPATILAGSKETQRYPGIKRRSEACAKTLKHSQYFVVEGAEHQVASPPYLQAIQDKVLQIL